MSDSPNLRPLERVIVRLNEEGVSSVEIGRRIGKKPGTVERILQWIDFKTDRPARTRPDNRASLRPIERVILRLRKEGENYGEIANRLGRSGAHIRRIEGYARLKS